MTGQQLAAARALLGINQSELSTLAGVSRPTISAFERGDSDLMPQNRKAIVATLQARGVEFLDDGVRLKTEKRKR